jgi:ribosome recycling factor
MSIDEVMMDAEEKMEKTVSVTKSEFTSIRTGKASPDLVSHLRIDAYGVTMTMKEVAAITTPDPRMILIQPWDVSNVDPIRKAIEESRIGITPMVDGKMIRLPIPALSEERRHDLVKTVKKLCEEGRVGIRNSRRIALDEIKRIQKAGEITEDDAERTEKEIQKLTDQYIAEVEKLMAAKEAELMKV